MKDKRIFVIPSSHLDSCWLGTREECLSRGNEILSIAIALARKDEDFRFYWETVLFLRDFLKNHPEKLDKLKRLVHKGKIELLARWQGLWQHHTGEMQVRNVVYAKKFIQEKFGVNPLSSHIMDIPSSTPQFPQILAKSGIKYFILYRGGPEDVPLYYWRAPDGSKVLAWNAAVRFEGIDYGLNESAQEMKKLKLDEVAEGMLSKCPTSVAMTYMIDLLLPPKNLCQNVREWNKQSELKMTVATPIEYFREVEDTEGIPELEGEIPLIAGAGAFEHPDQHPFTLEMKIGNMLLTAEKFVTISHILGYTDYPAFEIKEAWRHFLDASDHGSDATGGEEADKRAREWRRMAEISAEQIARDSLRAIAENVEAADESCIPIVVFNPLSWERTDIVTAHATIYGGDVPFRKTEIMCRLSGEEYKEIKEEYLLKDHYGNVVPCQVIEIKDRTAREITFVFIAEKVPPLGYKTYYLWPVEKAPEFEKACKVQEMSMENNYFTLSIDEKTGNLNVFDKEQGEEVLEDLGIFQRKKKTVKEPGKLPRSSLGKKLKNALKRIEVKEDGPVRAKLVIHGRRSNVVAKQEVTLYKKLRRIDLNTTVDWEKKRELGLMERMMESPLESSFVFQEFPVKVPKPSVTYGVPYGFNQPENVMPGSGPSSKDVWETGFKKVWLRFREIQKWIDLSGEEYGVTVATDRVSFKIVPYPIAACLVEWPDSCTSKFSIVPHRGGWKEAKAYRYGWELNNPLISVTVNDTFTKKRLPPQKSFCHIESKNVVMTVMKKAEDEDQIVLRFYEAEGKPTKTNIRFFKIVEKAAETNMLEEEPRTLKKLSFKVSNQEIKTIKMWV